MERTISDDLLTRLTEMAEFASRFGEVKTDVCLKIVDDVSTDVLKCRGIKPSLDRDFLNAFDDVIAEFCQSKLRLHPSFFARHLANARMIVDRRKARSAHKFESTEWYLALLGLTTESDPCNISSAFRSIMESESSSRRLFDQLHGGEPRTDLEILAIRRLVTDSLESVREYRKSLQKSAKPAKKPRKALPNEHCFSTVWGLCAGRFAGLPVYLLLDNKVKSAVCSFATRSNSRVAALKVGDFARISICIEALVFVHKEGLDIPLTSVSRCVGAYFLRPGLNIDENLLGRLRQAAETKGSEFYSLVSKAVRVTLCDETKGHQAAFPDPKEVSMAYSYLNLSVHSRQMYTDDEIDAAAQLLRSKLSKPHTGQYRSPYISDVLYIQWTEDSVMALKLASRALKNAMTRVKWA